MKLAHDDSNMFGVHGGVTVLLGSAVYIFVGVGLAAPPAEPLPVPFYSFDADSPKVMGGLLGPADILRLEADGASPAVAVPAAHLGFLGDPDDALTALSSASADLASGANFVLLVSVDRDTVGAAPPDPTLVERQVPYNATDQADKGQQAGDQYMSTVLCTLDGGCTLTARALTPNTSLVRNNYDEGGTDFGADPPTSAAQTAARAAQDNVNSTARLETSQPGGEVINVYFSATPNSSLSPSGADIFFVAQPAPMTEAQLFASFADLGLDALDDIDAMIVVDADQNRVFNAGDAVLLSLAPGSPTLGPLGRSPADVLRVLPGTPPGNRAVLNLFAPGAALGLDETVDNIDALDYAFCDNPEACAAVFGIRRLNGDFDDDGDVDHDDYMEFAACFTGPGGTATEGCLAGDFDGDDDIDCDDWFEFVNAWTEPGDPPPLPQCPNIPAASAWGLLIMLLLGMTIATVMFGRSRPKEA